MNILVQFDGNPLYFTKPLDIVSCNTTETLFKGFSLLEEALDKGYYVAGYLSFEAGYHLESCFHSNISRSFPLLKMGIYEKPQSEHPYSDGSYKISDIDINITQDNYSANIERIRQYISAGDVYQITYCIKMRFNCSGNYFGLYSALYNNNPVPYSVFIEADDYTILSLSPEMFLRKNKKHISTKPMKGTWHRGDTLSEDIANRLRFEQDEKNRAENLMITDLMRNDLGRLGNNVHVPKLFEVTPYRTLFQMTSTIDADIPEKISIENLFRALFPSGSVTGAPKIRAMEIIREIETEDRHIYTGAIGYIAPDRSMYFNIPIRTLLIRGNQGEMGIGGGIVWDSTPEGEWDEGMLKAQFLTELASKSLNKAIIT